MNQRILSTLGFDKVKQQLLQFIVTARGQTKFRNYYQLLMKIKFNHG